MWNSEYWWTDEEILPVFAQFLWTLKFIFSSSYGKLFLAIIRIFSYYKMQKRILKYSTLFWYKIFAH